MIHMPQEPERRYRTVDDMTPYFRSRNKRKRICPECHAGLLFVKPTLNPNAGVDKCPHCRYFQVVEAPAGARVPEGWTRDGSEKPGGLGRGVQRDGCMIIRFSDICPAPAPSR